MELLLPALFTQY